MKMDVEQEAVDVCDVCFDAPAPTVAVRMPTWSAKVAPEQVSAFAFLARDFALCARCREWIAGGRESELRPLVCRDIIACFPEHGRQTPLLVQVELAITLASATLRPFPHLGFTPGFQMLNAILLRFPQATIDGQPTASLLERDLGDGVIGTFTIVSGVLIIENFVSRVRGAGNGRRALDRLCALADKEGHALGGAVQANASFGLPPGAPEEALFAWYARVGFVPLFPGSNNVVRLPQARRKERPQSIRSSRPIPLRHIM